MTPALSLLGPLTLLPLQRVAPPPRVWLFVWPLFLGLAAIGMVALLGRVPRLSRRAWLVPLGAISIAALLGGRVLASEQVLESREAGIFRDGPAVAELFATTLEAGDRVVVESHPRWVLHYYLEQAGVDPAFLARRFADAERIFAVVYHPRGQDLESVLDEAGVPRERFVEVRHFAAFPETDVFLMTATG